MREWPGKVLTLLGLLASAEREAVAGMIVYSLALPALLGYFLNRSGQGGLSASASLAGPVALALGGPMAQVGYDWLKDIRMGRRSLIRSVVPHDSVYLYARIMLGVLEGTLTITAYLGILCLVGAIRPGLGSLIGMLSAAAAASLALCSLGALVAHRSSGLEKGTTLVGISVMVLGLASPVLYRIETLPGPLSLLARVSPLTELASTLRQGMSGDGPGFPVIAAFILQCALIHGSCILVTLYGRDRRA